MHLLLEEINLLNKVYINRNERKQKILSHELTYPMNYPIHIQHII